MPETKRTLAEVQAAVQELIDKTNKILPNYLVRIFDEIPPVLVEEHRGIFIVHFNGLCENKVEVRFDGTMENFVNGFGIAATLDSNFPHSLIYATIRRMRFILAHQGKWSWCVTLMALIVDRINNQEDLEMDVISAAQNFVLEPDWVNSLRKAAERLTLSVIRMIDIEEAVSREEMEFILDRGFSSQEECVYRRPVV